MSKEKDTATEKPLGMVLYTDGGCRPNPGFGGAGVHGYIYSDQKPKKGSGNASNYLTPQGYVEKAQYKDVKEKEVKAEKGVSYFGENELKDFYRSLPGKKLVEVKPLHYLDGVFSFGETVTNNIAEVVGVTNALRFAQNYDVKFVKVYTDSKQVVEGAAGRLDHWRSNGWVRADGNPVANRHYWLGMLEAMDGLKASGVDVNIEWVRGHNDTLGNDLADLNATVGVFHSKANQFRGEIDLSPADGYWKTTVDKHPFITHRRLIFNTAAKTVNVGEYYLGEAGKADELMGKRMADGCYAYVLLKNPELVIEILRQKQIQVCDGNELMVLGFLDSLYSKQIHSYITKHGVYAIEQFRPTRYDLSFVNEEPLTEDLRPPRLAIRAVDCVNTLKGLLLAFEENDPRLKRTDLTTTLYEIGKKGERKLKNEYGVGCAVLSKELAYGEEGKSCRIDLVLGVDLPDRNALKRMEGMSPTVTAITWMESPNMFRHATVIIAGEDKGIWAGMYSNTRLVDCASINTAPAHTPQ